MNWLADLRIAARGLLRSPTFSVVSVLALALGIGTSVAIFSVIYNVALKPLPWFEPDRIVSFSEVSPDLPGGRGGGSSFMLHNVREFRDRSEAFDGIAAHWANGYTLTGLDEPVRLSGSRVSPDLFGILGVSPLVGRTFTQDEVDAGEEKLAVLAHGTAIRFFDSLEEANGGVLRLDGEPYTVIGVMGPEFEFPDDSVELWVPLVWQESPDPNQRREIGLPVIGRLADGFSLEQAQSQGDTLLAAIRQERDARFEQARQQTTEASSGSGTHDGEEGDGEAAAAGSGGAGPAGEASSRSHAQAGPSADQRAEAPPQPKLVLRSLLDQQLEPVRPAMTMLGGAVLLVMLIACANVANLLLTRNLQRRRELATRAALGAARSGLARLLIMESLLLGLIGAVLGLGLATAGLRVIRSLDPGSIPRLAEVGLGLPVIAFAVGLALVTGALFGLVPALLLSFRRLISGLGREAGPVSGGRPVQGRLRGALAVAEVALALVLLIGAGLLANSFLRLINVDPGYQPEGVFSAFVAPATSQYPPGESRNAFYNSLLERVRSAPGVESAGLVNFLPPVQGRVVLSMQIEGQPQPNDPREVPQADLRVVSTGYIESMGISLLDGRTFDERDRTASESTVMVNKSFVDSYFDEGEPVVGERIANFGEIVGVVGDVRAQGLDSDPMPTMFLLAEQAPPMMAQIFSRMALVAKTDGTTTPDALVPVVRSQLTSLDSNVALEDVQPLAERLAESVALPRFYATIVSVFAGLALLLAVLGVYGVLSFAVSQETRQTGIRMALGAQQNSVVTRTLLRGVGLTAIGIVLGTFGALALRGLVAGMLFGIAPNDPMTFAGLAGLLLLVATVACLVPARRAASANPVEALRHE